MGVNLPHMSELFLPSNCVLLCNQLLMFCLIRSRWKHEGGSGWQETSHIIFHRPGARGSKHGHPGFRVELQRKEEDDVWAWVFWVCVIFSFTLMVFGAHWCGHHDGIWLSRGLLLNHMWRHFRIKRFPGAFHCVAGTAGGWWMPWVNLTGSWGPRYWLSVILGVSGRVLLDAMSIWMYGLNEQMVLPSVGGLRLIRWGPEQNRR